MGSPYRDPPKARYFWLRPDTGRDKIILFSIGALFVIGLVVQALRKGDTVDQNGALQPAEVLQVVGQNRFDLRERCFEGRNLATASVTASIEIGADGNVATVSTEGSDENVSSCVKLEVRSWKFPRHSRARGESFVVPFEFGRS